MSIIQEFKDGLDRMNRKYKKDTQERQKENVEKYMANINDIVIKESSFYPLTTWWYNKKTHSLIYDTYWNIIFKIKIKVI